MNMDIKVGIKPIFTFIQKIRLQMKRSDASRWCELSSVLLNSRNVNGSVNVLAESRTTYSGEGC